MHLLTTRSQMPIFRIHAFFVPASTVSPIPSESVAPISRFSRYSHPFTNDTQRIRPCIFVKRPNISSTVTYPAFVNFLRPGNPSPPKIQGKNDYAFYSRRHPNCPEICETPIGFYFAIRFRNPRTPPWILGGSWAIRMSPKMALSVDNHGYGLAKFRI